MSADPRTLDPTYIQARHRFLGAAERADARLRSWPHPALGLDGEELALDVVELGAADAAHALLVVSGTHGVEGFAGSALQSWWLDERASRCSPLADGSVRIVFIHAFNPYGFSWVRRVNEDNVDLNRNFVDWSDRPSNPDYHQIAELLVPASWSDETQQTTTGDLMNLAIERGMDHFQQVVSGGQYDHPTGIFYGGAGPVWSNQWLSAHLAEIIEPATRLGVIDLHTGLGPWGFGELISHEAAGEPGYDRGTSWWGEVRSMRSGESVSADLTGDWLAELEAVLPSVEVTCAALEFGTVDVVTVLQSLRADAWLHAHGDPTAESAAQIRAQVRAAFADDDPAWLAALIERFDSVLSAAVTALGR